MTNKGTLHIGSTVTVDTLMFRGGILHYLPGNTADISATAPMTFNAAGGATIDTDVNNVTFGNAVGNSGAGGLTKVGTGKLTLAGANTYSGGTTIAAGTLALGVANNRLPTAGTVTFGTLTPSAGIFDLGGFNQQVGGLAVASGAVASSQIIGNSSATASSTLIYNGGSSTFGGIIQDILGTGGKTVAVTVSGGTLTLTGANTYSGNTTLSAGTLALSGSGAIDSTALLSIAAGGTFDVSGLGATYNLSGNTILSASGTGTGGTAAAIKGNTTVNLGTQPVTLTYNGVNPALYVSQGTLEAQGNAWTINGSALAAGTTYTIASQASGTVSLSGSHTVYGTAISGLTATIVTDGGANLQLTTSAALTATATTLTSSGNNNTYGLGPVFTATLDQASATGTVLFVIDGVPQSPASISGGVATLTVNALAAGTHTVVAQYGGNATYGSSVSSPLSQTVVAKVLTMSGLSVPASKMYDGTTVAVVSGTPSLQASEPFGSGLASDGMPYTGDAVSLAGTAAGTYNSKDVGTATTVTYGGLSLNGARSGNYTPTLQSPDPATITAKALTVPNAAVTTKLYDGTTSATLTGSLVAEAPGTGTTSDGKYYTGDTLTLSGSGTFTTKDVGTGKAVTSTYTLGGGQVADYSLTQPTVTGAINPTNLTVTAVANTKLYDGTTDATATPTITAGTIQGTDTAPVWTENYTNRNAGTAKTLVPTALVVNDGNGGADYNYTYAAITTGIISQTNLTVTAVSNTKVYDGTTNAAATPAITSGSIQTGDTAAFTEAYQTPSVGTGKTLMPAGLVNDENFGTNYAYSLIPVSTGVITNPCSQTNALLSIADNLDGTFKLTFVGTLQAEYYVLTQTNLAEPMANWQPLADSTNAVTNPSGVWEFTITNATPQGFYRSAAINNCQ